MDFWSLGGLSVWELARRTAREAWEDSVFGQGGRMAFYQFLAIFPSLLVLLAVAAQVPQGGSSFPRMLQDLSEQVLPAQGAALFTSTMAELSRRAASSIHFLAAGASAVWASSNATWAMVSGLNRAYEVEERRSWRELAVIIGGLTVSLGFMTCVALFVVFGIARAETRFPAGAGVFHGVEFLAVFLSLTFCCAVLYRFAPSLRNHKWRWSTPGAVCAVVLWIGATMGARIYFTRVADYSRTYGHLNGVAVLLLWLYVTNGAILIGGEMNSEIAKAAGNSGPPSGGSGQSCGGSSQG